MLQRVQSFRLALLKFTLLLPVLSLCLLMALSFKKEVKLPEVSVVKETVEKVSKVFLAEPKDRAEQNERLPEHEESLLDEVKADTTKRYKVFFNISRFESSIEPLYRECANSVRILLYEKKSDGKWNEVDWGNHEPELLASHGKVIKRERKGEFYVIPDSGKVYCTLSVKESQLGIQSNIKAHITPIPPLWSSVMSGASSFYPERMNIVKEEVLGQVYFDLATEERFKFHHPHDAIFIPRDVLVIQYRGESEEEIQRKIFKDGQFSLVPFDIKEQDIIEVRLLAYEHVNALGEVFVKKLSVNTLNKHTFYFTIEAED